MNAVRRKRIDEIINQLEELRSELEYVMDEETEARDNMPENLQYTDRYQAMDEACDNLDSALSSIEEAMEYAEAAKGE